MKYIVHISRIFVGVLFILSGLIKLDDPLGFSYKLEEYFSAEVLNLEFLIPYALGISVIVASKKSEGQHQDVHHQCKPENKAFFKYFLTSKSSSNSLP